MREKGVRVAVQESNFSATAWCSQNAHSGLLSDNLQQPWRFRFNFYSCTERKTDDVRNGWWIPHMQLSRRGKGQATSFKKNAVSISASIPRPGEKPPGFHVCNATLSVASRGSRSSALLESAPASAAAANQTGSHSVTDFARTCSRSDDGPRPIVIGTEFHERLGVQRPVIAGGKSYCEGTMYDSESTRRVKCLFVAWWLRLWWRGDGQIQRPEKKGGEGWVEARLGVALLLYT
ncbi:hypothetical protein DFJ73DRAFT_967856 [Zopfochytrium polystomum]|nr:hypothetical protein DFJ73DRAFT_967856 [Zopfochytrium polystomum]